jgi:putative nucleotidyltransferase with HDIG domain
MLGTLTTRVIDTIAGGPCQPAAEEMAAARAAALCDELRRRFEAEFAVVDWINDSIRAGSAAIGRRATAHLAACRRASERGSAEIVHCGSAPSLLLVPLGEHAGGSWIGACEAASHDERTLLRTAELFVDKLRLEMENYALRDESRRLSEQIGSTFEEISLIYRLTRSLSISRSPAEIGGEALEWLAEVVPAESIAIYYEAEDSGLFSRDDAPMPTYLTHGRDQIKLETFVALLSAIGTVDGTRPLVFNHGLPGGTGDNGELSGIRQVVLAPLHTGERRFGWIGAFNQAENAEFGSGEASLLSSVGTILGMHGGNVDLYKQQAELFAGVVRAMSSAIDAKDPYTRGHSDRVARVSVRLCQELGCDQETIRTIYLAGLLHDVGKIGIDDNVLRKPGKLTDAEYEHIKSHVEIGYRILRGLKKMGHVLPIVLHHHESWDGKGYPYGLTGTNIPYLARIVAVADAFDAMSSDRPYRKGMPDEKLDAIFQAGAGKQWDPDVVAAFFRAREDIRKITNHDPDPVETVAVEWAH